jgi:hypothetical protein
MGALLPALRLFTSRTNCSFVDQVRPEPPTLHSFEVPDDSLATFCVIRVIKHASNPPTGAHRIDRDPTTNLRNLRSLVVQDGSWCDWLRLPMLLLSIDQPQLTSMGPASNQDGSITDRQAKEPSVKFALLRRVQVDLVSVLPALIVDIRNSTSGYTLQRVAEPPTKVLHVTNVDGT